jgi:hypothetical protein
VRVPTTTVKKAKTTSGGKFSTTIKATEDAPGGCTKTGTRWPPRPPARATTSRSTRTVKHALGTVTQSPGCAPSDRPPGDIADGWAVPGLSVGQPREQPNSHCGCRGGDRSAATSANTVVRGPVRRHSRHRDHPSGHLVLLSEGRCAEQVPGDRPGPGRG